MTQEPPELIASTGYLLARVGAQSRRIWARMLAEHDLTPHHYGILMVLDQIGAAPQQQLSRAVGVDPRNAVPLIERCSSATSSNANPTQPTDDDTRSR